MCRPHAQPATAHGGAQRGAAAEALAERFRAGGEPDARWQIDPDTGALLAHPALLRHLAAPPADAHVTYHRCLLLGAEDGAEEAAPAAYEHHPVDLGPGRWLQVTVVPASPPIPLDAGAARSLAAGATPAALLAWEQLPFGMPDYR